MNNDFFGGENENFLSDEQTENIKDFYSFLANIEPKQLPIITLLLAYIMTDTFTRSQVLVIANMLSATAVNCFLISVQTRFLNDLKDDQAAINNQNNQKQQYNYLLSRLNNLENQINNN